MVSRRVRLACPRGDIWGRVVSAGSALFLVAAILARGPALFARLKADAPVSEAGTTAPVDPCEPPAAGVAPTSSPIQTQIAALKREQIELAHKVVAEFPSREEAMVLMGGVLQLQARSEEASEFWRRALQINPRRADVHLTLGDCAMQRGAYEEAASSYRKVMDIDPCTAGLSGRLAMALMSLGRHQEAVRMLEARGQAGGASSLEYFLLGQAYLQLGQLDKAKANYETAVRLEPDYTNAHYGLFMACSRLGQQDKAQEHLALFRRLKAAELKVLTDRNDARSDLQDVRRLVANTYFSAHLLYADPFRPEEVEPLLRRATEIDPCNVVATRSLGAFYQAAGRAAEAEKVYRSLIHAAPECSDGYRELAQLYLRCRVQLAEAKQLAEKAVSLEPIAMNYFVLSRAYDQNGDPARALSALKQATDLEPANASYRQTYERLRARESKP
jgi:tetratricopeptide (TPR) repeat protein